MCVGGGGGGGGAGRGGAWGESQVWLSVWKVGKMAALAVVNAVLPVGCLHTRYICRVSQHQSVTFCWGLSICTQTMRSCLHTHYIIM